MSIMNSFFFKFYVCIDVNVIGGDDDNDVRNVAVTCRSETCCVQWNYVAFEWITLSG